MVEDMKVREGYKKTEVGVIPEDWEVVSFETAFKFLSSGSNSRNDLRDQGTINYIHYGDIHTKWDNTLDCDKENIPFIDSDKVKRLPKLEDGDLVLADASEDYEGIGKGIEIKNIKGREVVSGLHTFLLRGDKSIFADGFKGYIQKIKSVKNDIIKITTGTSVYGISKRNIRNILIPVPPLKEQKTIAKVITDTDNLIHSIQNLIDKKEKIKKGTMQELLTGKKRLDGFSGEWEKTKLGEIDLFISDGNYGELYPRPNEFIESGVPFLRANNIYKNNVVDKDLRFISNEKHQQLKSGHLKEGDILITTRGDIGNTAIVPKKFDGSNINAQICLIRINEKRKVNAMFMHYSFIGDYVQNQIETLQTGSALKQLPKGNLGKIEFKLPNIEEQKAIAKILSDMDKEIETLKEKLEKYKKVKKGMMQELLTGRIRLI